MKVSDTEHGSERKICRYWLRYDDTEESGFRHLTEKQSRTPPATHKRLKSSTADKLHDRTNRLIRSSDSLPKLFCGTKSLTMETKEQPKTWFRTGSGWFSELHWNIQTKLWTQSRSLSCGKQTQYHCTQPDQTNNNKAVSIGHKISIDSAITLPRRKAIPRCPTVPSGTQKVHFTEQDLCQVGPVTDITFPVSLSLHLPSRFKVLSSLPLTGLFAGVCMGNSN